MLSTSENKKSSLLDKMKNAGTSAHASILNQSIFLQDTDQTSTNIPMVNAALSGSVYGGLSSGFTLISGESKSFKTSFALVMASSYMKKHKDSVVLFYDSEFGSPNSYFKHFGVDTSKVIHIPMENIDSFSTDILQRIEEIDRKDKVMIIIDSIGNVASSKEVDDTLEGKTTVDMTRAKKLKALFRMLSTKLIMKDIPVIGITHVYKEMGLFPKNVVSGGTGAVYAANTVWIISRRKIKNTASKDLEGHEFVINIEKSRFVKEKSKIPITVKYDESGIEQFSGLLELAVEGGYITKGGAGYYKLADGEEKYRKGDMLTEEFWRPIFEKQDSLNSSKINLN